MKEMQNSAPKTPKRKLIKILSIDGGGIRGIIPALILQEIEKKHSTRHFLRL
jgi:patatin-like phospholipase/acyl hydrolase